MSRHSSHERVVTITDATEILEVIREEQCSPALSSVNMDAAKAEAAEKCPPCTDCECIAELHVEVIKKEDPAEIDKIVLEREATLRKEFQQQMVKETEELKERFDFILQ